MRWCAELAIFALPAILIVMAAVPRLMTGIALEEAFPTTGYLVDNVPMPKGVYAQTAHTLSAARAQDGETALLRAEAALRAGESPSAVLPIAIDGLSHDPAFARGWIVLADALRDHDPKQAAAALTLGIQLAPRSYYLLAPQTQAGAPLWAYLDNPTREKLLGDTLRLARDQALWPDLVALMGVQGGSALVTRALSNDPDELRTLNRKLARERLGLR